MKRSIRIMMLSTMFVLVGLVGFFAGYTVTMEARFPCTISHAFSKAPDGGPGSIYPASCAVLWLLHDTDFVGHNELRYVLRVSSSTGDREYLPVSFSVEEAGGLLDAGQARFTWSEEEPTLVFRLGQFHHRFKLGKMFRLHKKSS